MLESQYITDNFIIPIAITIITSIGEKITSNKSSNKKETAALKKAINKAIDSSELVSLDHNTKQSIEDRLFFTILYEPTKFDIKNILKEVSKDNPGFLYTINLHKVELQLSYNLANSIISIPSLRILISYNTMARVLEISRINEQSVQNLNSQINNLQAIFLNEMEDIKSYMEMITNMSLNSQIIMEEYQTYFSKPLFLEQKMKDGKVACLKDVYVENSFEMLDFNLKKEGRTGLFDFIEAFCNNQLLTHNYATKYSISSDEIVLLFIKGQPGSGKSSLFYALAHYKTHNFNFIPNKYFYFVKLIECFSNVQDGDINNPLNTIMMHLHLNYYSLNKDCVLVLDGLDEICTLKGFDSQRFCEQLIVGCILRKCKCIVTTRVNYITIPHTSNKNVINILLHSLSTDDLQKWLSKYFFIHADLNEEKAMAQKNLKYIVESSDATITEIFAIPLLFYMIVSTSINIQKISSIGQLYDKVFEELKFRRYNDNPVSSYQRHISTKLFRDNMSKRIAMEIAMIMYKSNTLLLRINSKQLKDALNIVSEEYMLGAEEKENIEKLYPITFFYKQNNDVVEFAHKSIMEYFAAYYLYNTFKSFKGTLGSYIIHYLIDPIITAEVLSFFMYFLDLDHNLDIPNQFYDESIIKREFTNIINPHSTISIPGVLYKYEETYIFFKIYWFFLRKVLHVSSGKINKMFLLDGYIRPFIDNIFSLNYTNSSSFVDNALFPWDFSDLNWQHITFSYCHLKFMDFSNSIIDKGRFEYCNLQEILFKSKKIYCIFDHCSINKNLYSGFYTQKNLYIRDACDITFTCCNITNSIFSNINLLSTHFNSCDFASIVFNTVLVSLESFSKILPFISSLKNTDIFVDFEHKRNIAYLKANEIEDEKGKEQIVHEISNEIKSLAPQLKISHCNLRLVFPRYKTVSRPSDLIFVSII